MHGNAGDARAELGRRALDLFTATHGFQGMSAVSCAAILASIPFTGRLEDADKDRPELRDS